MISNSITVFYGNCGVWRILFAYIGGLTPTIILLTFLLFYDAKTTLCYKYGSTFLLDNYQTPKNLRMHKPSNESILEDFEAFKSLLFAGNNSVYHRQKWRSLFTGKYHMNIAGFDEQVSWEYFLENLSTSNKYFLMKTLKTRRIQK